MDSNPPNITVPSEPLQWWAYSKIAKWRHFVGVAGIIDADPKELSIFDWKIIFEIALRSSTWRLCPSMILGKSCEIPIFGTIQELDFVTGKAIFRLHPRTTAPLVRQHAKYIFSRRGNLPPKQAIEILRTFERRIDVLQIRLYARVVEATDGTPGADFPQYASDPSAKKSVVDMLSIVLKENGLRKTILDAFVEIQPSVPSFVFNPSRSLGGESAGSVQSIQSTHTSPPPIAPPPQFPLSELHSLISKPQAPQNTRAENLPPPANSSLKRKQTSTPILFAQSDKRVRTSPTKPKAIKSLRPATTESSPLTTEVKWSDPPSPSSTPREPPIRQRSRKSPSACSSINSGNDINTPTPVAANTPEPNPAKPVQEAKEPTLTIIPDERSSVLPSSSNKTTLKVRRVSLNNDELAIYKMDSSLAPATRQQAAIELKETTNSATGVGSVRTLKKLASQRLPSVQRSPSRNSKDTDGEEDSWYDTHEQMGPNHLQEEDRAQEAEAKDEEMGKKKKEKFGMEVLIPSGCQKPDPREKKKKKGKKRKTRISDLNDYTDAEDLVLDSDTPTVELLCDSGDSEDHRDRKRRRRERKKLKAAKLKRMEDAKLLDEEIAVLEAELERRNALEAVEGADENQSYTQDGNEAMVIV
ncbi:uncharacterized protein DFL_005995 [Arthrobotrys flagrans]|uniref:Uncharacterized protein n=1 Tax=Arthrobotrys flagrans TaxID=97331 RepID=A0A436ZZ51_ARTFL|nr:hypothetical protein DFL_005995 [Arthrobotrys flagrans]